MSDSWIENSLYPMTVTHSEQSWGILYGPRIMSPTRRGFLRPYFGIKGGLFVFSDPGGAKPILAFVKLLQEQLKDYQKEME